MPSEVRKRPIFFRMIWRNRRVHLPFWRRVVGAAVMIGSELGQVCSQGMVRAWFAHGLRMEWGPEHGGGGLDVWAGGFSLVRISVVLFQVACPALLHDSTCSAFDFKLPACRFAYSPVPIAYHSRVKSEDRLVPSSQRPKN